MEKGDRKMYQNRIERTANDLENKVSIWLMFLSFLIVFLINMYN